MHLHTCTSTELLFRYQDSYSIFVRFVTPQILSSPEPNPEPSISEPQETSITQYIPSQQQSPDVMVSDQFIIITYSMTMHACLCYYTIQVTIKYPSGTKVFKANTPLRKRGLKTLARRHYKSLASTVMASTTTSTRVVTEVAQRIRAEMKAISSQRHDSILLDTVEAVKHFSWETILLELQHMMPTLMNLLNGIVICKANKKVLLCFLASQLLKQRYAKLDLVQRAISVCLYGNGTNKQV